MIPLRPRSNEGRAIASFSSQCTNPLPAQHPFQALSGNSRFSSRFGSSFSRNAMRGLNILLAIALLCGPVATGAVWFIRANFSISTLSTTTTGGWSIFEGNSCINLATSRWCVFLGSLIRSEITQICLASLSLYLRRIDIAHIFGSSGSAWATSWCGRDFQQVFGCASRGPCSLTFSVSSPSLIPLTLLLHHQPFLAGIFELALIRRACSKMIC